MRIKHTEQREFFARFPRARTADPLHSVRIEIETAGGDLAAVAYVSEADYSRAAGWLRLFRIAREVYDLDHPVPAVRSLEASREGPTDWTFESHRQNCPRCGRRIMRAATVCGYCWARLEPMADLPAIEATALSRAYIEPVSASRDRAACTRCGHMIMPDAMLCGYCWSREPNRR